jgi:hypothetical protein
MLALVSEGKVVNVAGMNLVVFSDLSPALSGCTAGRRYDNNKVTEWFHGTDARNNNRNRVRTARA